jgi:hypothetical protein
MESRLADDLMVGAKAIATWLGVPERKVFYWAETKRIPIFRVGSQLAGRKSTIARHLEKLEAEAGEAA